MCAAVCDRMGVYDEFTMGGKTDYDWVKDYFHATDSPTNITWADVDKSGLRAES